MLTTEAENKENNSPQLLQQAKKDNKESQPALPPLFLQARSKAVTLARTIITYFNLVVFVIWLYTYC